jgi:hypothetical protein
VDVLYLLAIAGLIVLTALLLLGCSRLEGR